ncbi:uncharacterized protein LOC143474829 [Brachyhypopomus gauderio]|uniref:uncharacterized protein LOC143474829 n=1 Tax=Brachyhypopomus gauderio TaxID=698409 RepID=UPI004040F33F
METEAAPCREVAYPEKCRSAQAKKKHKQQILQENPDTLYADYIQIHGNRVKNNLIFHTAALSAWRSAICSHYHFTFKEGIGRGGRITVCTDELLDTENPVLTITYYTKGTVLVQGNELSLNSFQLSFPHLRAQVEREVDSTTVNGTDSEEDSEAPPTQLTTAPPTQPTTAPPPSPSDKQLRESLAMLELDFTEFKEHTQARLSHNDTSSSTSPIQQLREEVLQIQRESQASIAELRVSLRELQQENHSLRAQIAKLKEEEIKRVRTLTTQIQDVKEQIQNTRPCASASTQTPPDTDYTKHSVTSSPPSSDILSLPHQPNPPEKEDDPPPHTQKTPAEPTPHPQPTTATSAKQKPHVVLLMDSNRRFLDPQKLFPGHTITAKRCSTTGHTLQLLKKEALGCPQCIIIHTGTNDLHTQRSNTAEAVRKVAERASTEFPESRIIISTLLARSDTPPHVISSINAEISRGCASLPNVHLAYHHSITPRHMHDGIHLHEDGVRIFAKTLKDAALGRNTVAPHFTPPAGSFRPPPLYIPRQAAVSWPL